MIVRRRRGCHRHQGWCDTAGAAHAAVIAAALAGSRPLGPLMMGGIFIWIVAVLAAAGVGLGRGAVALLVSHVYHRLLLLVRVVRVEQLALATRLPALPEALGEWIVVDLQFCYVLVLKKNEEKKCIIYFQQINFLF